MTPTILALLLAAGLPVPPQASQLPPWYHWLFEAFRPAGGGSGTILTVTGISPLALVNALAAPIHSLTQYGKCVQDGTPTPVAPVDILCNNGVLRYGALGSNLYDPSTAVFEVGYYYNPNADGAQTAAANNFIYHSYIPIEAGATYVFYGRQKNTNRISQYNRIHFYDAEKTYISTNTYTAGAVGKGVAPDNAVYARLSCNPQGASTAISEETVLSYNWMFAEGTAEITPFVPFVGGIYTDGNPETLTISGINLLDPSTSSIVIGQYYNANGATANGVNNWRTGLIPITGGKTYAFWGRAKADDTISAYNRINWFTADKTHISPRPSYTVDTVTVGTAPSNAAFARLSCSIYKSDSAITREQFDLFNWMFAEASAEVPYQPYVAPQTVTVPMLLGVGDYKDAAELIQGIKTGRVGVKVFDGTEDWTAYNSSTLVIQNATSAWGAVAGVGGYCTHLTVLKAGETTFAGSCRFGTALNVYEYKTAFGVADVAGFKAKLAEQYANGTPVIVIYPRTNEQTEQTTAHALHSYNGTTIVTAQTNVDPVTLRVEYKGVST